MRFSPFSAYGGGQPGTLAGYSWLCFLPLAARRFDQLSPWVTIAPLWLSFRQSSLHPRTQFLSQPLSRRLLIGGLAPFPTCFGHCSWFPSQLSRMITGLCVSPGALLSAHFCSAHAAFFAAYGRTHFSSLPDVDCVFTAFQDIPTHVWPSRPRRESHRRYCPQ